MKILESKYYREIKILGVNGDDELELFDKNRYLTSKALFNTLFLNGLWKRDWLVSISTIYANMVWATTSK